MSNQGKRLVFFNPRLIYFTKKTKKIITTKYFTDWD